MKIGEIIELDNNNRYVVVDMFEYQNQIIVYLSDINNLGNLMYCKLIDNELEPITDSILLKEVIKIVNDHTHNN
jgi:hypothetical protein